MDENVKIEIDFQGCIEPDAPNEVMFIIKNNSSESVIIHAWHLYLIELYTYNGKELEPHTIIEDTVPDDFDEYVCIKANSTEEISFTTEFFQTFNLDRNRDYYVKGEYNGSYSEKGEKFKVSIDKKRIKTCR